MKISYRILILSTMLCAGAVCSQAQEGSVGGASKAHFYRQAHLLGEQTLLTLGKGFGNQEDIILEAQLAPRYGIVRKGRPWALMFDPKIVLRMANEKSYPLKPPSYHVDATYYRSLDQGAMVSDHAMVYLGIGHHSNGQAGTFFFPGDTIINTVNGNFAQNHFEVGLTTYRNTNEDDTYVRFRYLGVYARITPPFTAKWSGHETLDRLGFYRPFIIAGIGGVRVGKRTGMLLRLREQSQVKLRAGYILGKMLDTATSDVNKRAVLDVQYHYVLPFFNDMSLMLRYYHGQDYYNILYDHTLDVFTIGFSSNIAKMKSAVRYL